MTWRSVQGVTGTSTQKTKQTKKRRQLVTQGKRKVGQKKKNNHPWPHGSALTTNTDVLSKHSALVSPKLRGLSREGGREQRRRPRVQGRSTNATRQPRGRQEGSGCQPTGLLDAHWPSAQVPACSQALSSTGQSFSCFLLSLTAGPGLRPRPPPLSTCKNQ